MKRGRTRIGFFLVAATLALWAGWRMMWFLTDDAFIHFRYVGNSFLGHGYVWNPPPFLPVEGYTSFLWVLLLDLIWRTTGVLPPESANALALFFSWLSLLLTAHVVLHMRLGEGLERRRPWLLCLVLLGLVTHRTFLTWTSSGLETAMFDFWVLAWLVAACKFSRERSVASGLVLSACVSLVYLTRPEGLLFGAATVVMFLAAGFERRALAGGRIGALAAALPMAAIPIHLAWRIRTYGDWLPNTYYAKHVAPWPESGVHYALSYTLEHAMWFWALPFAVFAPRLLRGRWTALRNSPPGGPLDRWIRGGAIADLAALTFLANLGYYTFVIGGDSFEYRIYAQLVPVTLLTFVWVLDRGGLKPSAALAAMASLVVLSAPIAWLHWRLALEVPAESAANEDVSVTIAQSMPGPLRWYGELFDEQQNWLVPRFVCGRHHSHVHFTNLLLETYPERDLEARMPLDDIPVLIEGAVGVAGWTLPHVAVIDKLGLNDYVAARNPVPLGQERRMAHDRRAPEEYLAELRPNVFIRKAGRIRIRPRKDGPLTADRVVEIEREWWGRARRGELGRIIHEQ